MTGKKLLALMREKRVSQSQLAREMRLTPTSIGRYIEKLDNGSIPEEVWSEMVNALRRTGIDAEKLRPVRTPAEVREDLIPLLDFFTTTDQMDALLQILEGHKDSQAIVRLLLKDRLKHSR
jgi:transcriptional regulator with XRE-family HTH domain